MLTGAVFSLSSKAMSRALETKSPIQVLQAQCFGIILSMPRLLSLMHISPGAHSNHSTKRPNPLPPWLCRNILTE